MKNKDTKEIVRTALLLFLICAVAAGILAGVNLITAPRIAEAAAQAAQSSKASVLPVAASFEDVTLSDGSVGYRGLNENGDCVGYVFSTSASSYGGKLQLMTGFDTNGVVTGISLLGISDTPGLGMNAKKAVFQSQFMGTDGELTVIKSGTAGKNQIQAITSATITSTAVSSCVNTARQYFNELNAAKEGN